MNTKADLDHRPAEDLELAAFSGLTFSTEDYSLSTQRVKIAHNWIVSGGVQWGVKHLLLELRMSYERGLTNLIKEEERYNDQQLLDDYSYVADDYKVNSWNISFSVMRRFMKPKKRKS